MDLGMFKPGRTGFTLWLAAPPAIMAAVLIPSALYCREVNRDCERRLAVLKEIPEMNRLNTLARETLKAFEVQPEAGDFAAEASLRIQRAAREHNFAVRSLTADKAVSIGSPGVVGVAISSHGEGTLPAVIEMFDNLHRPSELCIVDSVKLKLLQSVTERLTYSGQMILKCHAVAGTGKD